MRDYGRVYTAFWTSADIQALSDDAKMLALYLLSGPHGTIAGVCRLPDGYVCEDLRWTSERVSEGFAELFRNGFANRCESTKWVWIRKFLEWNTPENPNQWKAARKIAEQIPAQSAWKAEFSRVFALAAGDPPPSGGNPSGTVPRPSLKPLPTQEQEQEQEQNQKQEQEQEQEQEQDATERPTPSKPASRDRKSSKAKPEPSYAEGELPLHDSLPRSEWGQWIDWRRQRRWPLDMITLSKQLAVLTPYDTETQREMINTSINAGWQGIFPPKGLSKTASPSTTPTGKPMSPAEAARREAIQREWQQLDDEAIHCGHRKHYAHETPADFREELKRHQAKIDRNVVARLDAGDALKAMR